MADNWQTLLTQFQATSPLELVAVVFAILYLALAMVENRSCWYFALGSTALYTVIFWNVDLVMESGLQIYYLAMAVFGWWQWRPKNKSLAGPSDATNREAQASGQSSAVAIHRWGLWQHLIAITAVIGLSLASGSWLQGNSEAARPFLDSFTTWGAVLTTYMVTRKVLENWIYWFVIDGLSIYLYLDRGLVFTAMLFVVYEFMVIAGFLHWRKQLLQENAIVAEAAQA